MMGDEILFYITSGSDWLTVIVTTTYSVVSSPEILIELQPEENRANVEAVLQYLEPYSFETADTGYNTALELGSTMDVSVIPDYVYTIEAVGVSQDSCSFDTSQDYQHLVIYSIMGPYDNGNGGSNCAVVLHNEDLYEFDDPVELVISDGVNSWTAVVSATSRIYDDLGYEVEQFDDAEFEDEVTIMPVGSTDEDFFATVGECLDTDNGQTD